MIVKLPLQLAVLNDYKYSLKIFPNELLNVISWKLASDLYFKFYALRDMPFQCQRLLNQFNG